MPASSPPVLLKAGQWTDLYAATGIPVGTKLNVYNPDGEIVYLTSSASKPATPPQAAPKDRVIGIFKLGYDGEKENESGDPGAWAFSFETITIQVERSDSGWKTVGQRVPDGLYSGTNAETVQFYDEANKKAGVQWEAARVLNAATTGEYFYSVIKTGSKPLDLKQREFAYTGIGIYGFLYKNPTYTGGNEGTGGDPVFNMTDINPQNREMVLISGITIASPAMIPLPNGTNAPAAWGTPQSTPVYAIGPNTNQTSGSTALRYASNRILAPNTEYLLIIYSLDNQNITARLEFYEGELDITPEAP